MKKKIIFISTLAFLFLGCSKSTVVLLDSGKSHNAILVSTDKGSTKLDKIGSFIDLKDKEALPSKIKMMSKEEIKSRFSKVLAVSPKKAISHILYFKTNSTELTENSKKELINTLNSIKERSPCMVDIIGHTDTVGSNKDNIKVSLKRAKYIASILKKKNIKVVSLSTKGFGEEDLLVNTPDNTEEEKNRNVEVFIK